MGCGTKLKVELAKRNISQIKLSDMTGIAKSTIGYQLNREYPDLEHIEAICKAIDVPIWSLFIDSPQDVAEYLTPQMSELSDLEWAVIHAMRDIPEERKARTLEGILALLR